jgi:hypothetical protein
MSWLDIISPQESNEWQEVILAYAFDVEEWGDAREKLLKLLQNDQRKADEVSIRSYISCCAESIGSVHPLPDLSEIVSEFYQKYGMESSNNIPE